VGGFYEARRLGDNGAAGNDRDARKPGLNDARDRLRADRRQVETAGPCGLWSLHPRAGAGTPADAALRAPLRHAPAHGMGSFGRLDREHVAARHHHGLADVEWSRRVQVIETECDITSVRLGWLRLAELAFGHQDIRCHLVRAQKAEALLLEHLAHAAQEVI